MTEHEKAQLRALNEFMELLGVSEMTDEQWNLWCELNDKLRKIRAQDDYSAD